jgi:hypothetical protein
MPAIQEPLDSIVGMYSEKLAEMAGAEPFSVDKIIEFNLRSLPDEQLPQSPAEQLKEALAAQGLDGKLQILTDKCGPSEMGGGRLMEGRARQRQRSCPRKRKSFCL